MRDGSRMFFERPENISWEELRARIESLQGAQMTGFVSDEMCESWLELTFRGQKFSVNNPLGEFWFFVEDTLCPPEILGAIIAEFSL